MITAVWLLNYRRSLAYGLGDDFPAGKEYNEGEYIVFINKSGIVSVVHQSGAAIDEFSYADFYGLSAENLGDNVEIGMPEQSELQATVAVS
ncbi:MAG: hypothetical protein IPN95_27640 [Bacteroidetes bacterium]|nr:hypothetical protein [Bacteroidota bacterium]